MKTAPELLREAATTYEERNKLYGDNYKRFGQMMIALFPDGLTLKSVDDFNRIGVLVQCVSKLSRYAENFDKGGHDDSCLDSSVYWSMLRELDQLARQAPAERPGSDRFWSRFILPLPDDAVIDVVLKSFPASHGRKLRLRASFVDWGVSAAEAKLYRKANLEVIEVHPL